MEDRSETPAVLETIGNNKEVILVAGVGVIMILFGVGEWKNSQNLNQQVIVAEESESQDEVIGDVVVDVSGAVKNPGVYRFSEGARVGESLEAAGGFSDDVNSQWVSENINLAAKLKDGVKLYIPYLGDEDTSSITWLGEKENLNSDLVNINTASMSELDNLVGIGAARAQTIIDNRPYLSIEELKSKATISESVFEKIKDKVIVE